MNNGWIKLHRSLLDWEWYDDANVKILFLHCLFMANHKDKNYRGTLVKRGTFLTGRELLAEQTGLTVRQVRTALTKLESTSELTIKSSSKGTVVEVVNYHAYQGSDQQNDQPTTSKRPASDQPATSNKNDKKEKNDKNEKKTYYTEAEGLVIPQDFLDKMIQTYLRINVANQIKGMEGWLLANPKKRKKNYESFINNWLSRADKDAPSAGGQPILF